MQIKKKEAPFALLFFILPISIPGLLFYRYTTSTLADLVHSTLQARSQHIGAEMALVLATGRQRARDFSSDGTIRQTLARSLARADPVADYDALRDYMIRQKLPLDPSLDAIEIQDTQGTRVVTTASGMELNFTLRAPPAARGESANDPTVFHGLAAEASARRYAVSALLLDIQTSQPLGRIVLWYSIDRIEHLLKTHDAAEAGSRDDDVLFFLIGDDAKVTIGPRELIGDSLREEDARLTLSGRVASIGHLVDRNGVEYLTTSIDVEAEQWRLVAAVPREKAYAPLRRLTVIAILIIAGTAILTTFAAIGLASRVSRPIRAVSEAAQRIAAGNYSERVRASGPTEELQALAAAFNTMASELGRVFETLESRERRYRALTEQTTDGTILCDVNGLQTYVSPPVREILGVDPEQLVARNLFEIVHPQDQSTMRQNFADVILSAGVAARTKCRLHYADGTYRWVEAVTTNLLSDPAVGALVMNLRDVTERQAAEAAMRGFGDQQAAVAELGRTALVGVPFGELLQRTAEVVSSVLDVDCCQVLELLPDQKCLLLRAGVGVSSDQIGNARVDATAATLAGYTMTRDELVIVEDFTKETRFEPPASLSSACAVSGMSVTVRGEDRPFGVICVHSTRLRPFRADEGRFLLSVANVIATAAERSRLSAQLLQAQKMESVGRLAGGVAHDFNNLLTVIMGTAEVALMDLPEGSPIERDLREIHSAGQRAATLTRQLLAFARREILEPRIINLNDTIMNLDKMLRRLIGEDIELVVIPGADAPMINADPGQIEQVLINMAVNARDAMPTGGVLRIETARALQAGGFADSFQDLAPGDYLRLEVRDTGTGMSDEVRARLFEPFFTTKQAGKGTGLGLATCFGIVKQHGGGILVDSRIGEGTSFTILIPSAKGEAARASLEGANVPAHVGGNETILLVEDDPALRALAFRCLTSAGYRVLQARTGDEAISLLSGLGALSLHMLLSDVVMPHMSGTDLAVRVKRDFPDVVILLMSGYIEDRSFDRAADIMSGFIQKPFTTQLLLRKVREVFDRKSDPRSPARA